MFVTPFSLHAANFDFTVCSGCGAAPFGTVTLTQNGANVDVTVQLKPGNSFVKTGATDLMAFKFNATGVTLTDITVTQSVPGQTLTALTGPLNSGGTGNFAFGITCATCANGASGKFNADLVFRVANASVGDLSIANNLGIYFVAGLQDTSGYTGPVSSIAEPSSIMLLGFAMVGLGAACRFRKKE